MKTIWKYPLSGPSVAVEMPKGAKILALQMQDNTPTLWALVDSAAEKEERRFQSVGTGWWLDESECDTTHIGTFQKGRLVFHVFELQKKP